MKQNTRLILAFTLFGIAMVLLGSIISPIYELSKPSLASLEIRFIKHNQDGSCNNLSLSKTSSCLQDELSVWYNYNSSNKNKHMSEEQLKSFGGVCWHYAEWYKKEMSDLGFYSYTMVIRTNKTTTHEFAVASDNSGYCILDQLNVWCIKYT